MTATVLYMSTSLDGYIAGPKFREAVPISEVRHVAAPIEPRRKWSNQCRSPPFSPLSPSPMLELRLFRGRLRRPRPLESLCSRWQPPRLDDRCLLGR
jgi:hypothetical protein